MIFINSSSVVADNNPKADGLGVICLEQEDIILCQCLVDVASSDWLVGGG